MAGQLIPLEEAAKLLKMTPAELNDMRSRSEIFGVRTGASWKFKMEEIERVAEERGISLGAGPAAEDEFNFDDVSPEGSDSLDFDALDLEDEGGTGASSILVSEHELGASNTPSSTIIGQEGSGRESDLILSSLDDDDLSLAPDSGVRAAPRPQATGPQAQAQAQAAESDLQLASDSAITPAKPSRPAEDKPAGNVLEPSESDRTGGSDLELSGDSDLELGAEVLAGAGESDLLLAGADDISTGDTGRLDKKLGKTTDLEFATDDLDIDVSASGSALDLGGADDDLVLDSESALDGDVALAGDSGINLTRPSDSGIDLASADQSGISISGGESGFMLEDEDAMELEGGSSVDSLELPDDVDVVSLDEELTDPDAATQLKSEDDFDLTPVEGAIEDESDSGSQVIALETEELDPGSPVQMGGFGVASAPSMDVAEALITEEPMGGVFDSVPTGQPQPGLAVAGQQPTQFPTQELPEAPYSVWQVGSLAVVALMLAFTGILMIDVVRNIWSFDQPYGASTAIMNSIIEALGI